MLVNVLQLQSAASDPFVGAYRDTSDRLLPYGPGSSRFNLTQQQCATICYSYPLYALQYSGCCFCGDNKTRAEVCMVIVSLLMTTTSPHLFWCRDMFCLPVRRSRPKLHSTQHCRILQCHLVAPASATTQLLGFAAVATIQRPWKAVRTESTHRCFKVRSSGDSIGCFVSCLCDRASRWQHGCQR